MKRCHLLDRSAVGRINQYIMLELEKIIKQTLRAIFLNVHGDSETLKYFFIQSNCAVFISKRLSKESIVLRPKRLHLDSGTV